MCMCARVRILTDRQSAATVSNKAKLQYPAGHFKIKHYAGYALDAQIHPLCAIAPHFE